MKITFKPHSNVIVTFKPASSGLQAIEDVHRDIDAAQCRRRAALTQGDDREASLEREHIQWLKMELRHI